MTCTYCNTDHGDMDCDIREYVDQLALIIDDQAAVICHQIQELEAKLH